MSTSASVLFDAPGPRTVARHRVYTVIAVAGLLAVVAFVVWRLYAREQLTYEKWEVFVTPTYMTAILVDGVLVTLQMAVTAVLFATVFGVVFGVGKLSDRWWIRWPCWAVVEFFRAVPVLLLMILVWFSYGIAKDGASYWAVVVALTLYNGAVLAEVFRAGIQAVPQGQSEAAYAIGMRKTQVTTIVLLPQGVKIMLPAIISQMVVALKDTSLGYAVAAPGLTAIGDRIYGQFQNQVPTAIVLALLYISMNLVLSLLATVAQKKLVGEKKPLEVAAVSALDAGRAT